MFKPHTNLRVVATGVLFVFVILSACQPAAAPPGSLAASPPVHNEPTRDPLMPTRAGPTPRPLAGNELSAEQLMLISHTTWNTLQAEAEIHSFASPNAAAPVISEHVQVWIHQPAQFRTLVRPAAGGAVRMTVSDGQNIRYDTGETSPLPAYMLEPFTPPSGPSDSVTPHPLEGSLGTPLAALLFPAGLAQRDGEYQVVGKDILIGRTAIILEWSYIPGQLNDRLWIDEQTGIILRQQNFGKEQSNTPQSEILLTRVSFDGDIPAETFAIDQPAPSEAPALPGSGDAFPQISVLKNDVGYINVRSGPGTSFAVINRLTTGQTARVTGIDPSGEWWQIDIDGVTGWVWSGVVEFYGDRAAVSTIN